MKTASKLIIGALAAGIALPAFAQTPPPAAPAAPAAAAEKAGPKRPDGPRHHGKHNRQRPSALWMVAGKLAAAETALGITADQEDAWNAFTAAAIAFAEAGRPTRGGPEMTPPPAPDAGPAVDEDEPPLADDGTDDDVAAGPERGPFARVNRMLERSIQRGEAAETLRDAMTTLAGQLTPEQTAIAEQLLRELPRHGHGPQGPGKRFERGGPDRGGPDRGGPDRGGPDRDGPRPQPRG